MLDMFSDDYAQAAQPNPREGRDLPATFGESMADAWSNGQLATSGIKQANARDQAVSEYIGQIKQAGGDFDSEYAKQISTGPGDATYEPNPLDVANNVVASLRARGATLPFKPMTSDDIDDRAVQISQGAVAAHSAMAGREQTFVSRVGGFLGGAASGVADPYNIPLMAIPVEGLGILGTAAAFGAGSALTQGANEAVNAPYNERVQPGYAASGQAGMNILEAGASGAVMGGGLKVAGNVLTRMLTGAWPTAARDAANGIQSEANILDTNVLPGAEGEAAHNDALGQAIKGVLTGEPVDVSRAIAPASDFDKRIGDLQGGYTDGTTLSGPYVGPVRAPASETNIQAQTLMSFLKAKGGIVPSTAMNDLVKGYPGLINKRGMDLDTARELAAEAGYLGPDIDEAVANTDVNDLFNALHEGKVYSVHDLGEVNRAQDAEAFNQWFDAHASARDEVQAHVGARGEEPLDPEWADLAAEHRRSGDDVDTAIERGAHDLYMKDFAQSQKFRETPEMPELGYEIPPPERAAGYEGEQGARDYYEGVGGSEGPGATSNAGAASGSVRKGGSDTGPLPSSLTADEISERLASPETLNAMRADVERAVDDGAKAGNAPKIPIGIDENGEPIMGSVHSALGEVDRLNELADQIAACALPGAMQEAAE